MTTEPVRDPVAEGVKNIVISQVPAGAIDDAVHVWTPLNSAEFEMLTADTCSGAFPVFVSFKVSPALLVPVGALGNERLVGEIVIAGCGGAAPVPFILTVRSAILLLMMSEPVRDPVAEGVKNIVISQVPAGAIANAVHVWTPLNSAEFEMITDDTCSAAFPVFVSLNFSPALLVPVGVLGNERLVGEIVIAGCGGVAPVPFKLSARSAVLLLMTSEPVRDPVVEGVKNTVISQVPAGAIDALEQVWTALNSAELEMITDDTCSAAFPVFVTFNFSPALLVPVGVLGNERLAGEIVIAG